MNCSSSSNDTVLLSSTTTLAALLAAVIVAVITCTGMNIKLRKDKVNVKEQLKAMVRQSSGKVERDHNTTDYDSIDNTHQDTPHNMDHKIDISDNAAYSTINDL